MSDYTAYEIKPNHKSATQIEGEENKSFGFGYLLAPFFGILIPIALGVVGVGIALLLFLIFK